MEAKLFMYVVLFGIVASERQLDGYTANDILSSRKYDDAAANAQNEVQRKVESPNRSSPLNSTASSFEKPKRGSEESESGSGESESGSGESESGSGESESGSHQITRSDPFNYHDDSDYGSGTSAVSTEGKGAVKESIPTESEILIETAEPQMRTAKPQEAETSESKQSNTRNSSNDAASKRAKTTSKTTIERDTTTSGKSAVSTEGKGAPKESISTVSEIVIDTAEPQMRTLKSQEAETSEWKQSNTRNSSNDAASKRTKTTSKTTSERDATTSSIASTTKMTNVISKEGTVDGSENRVIVGISTHVVLETAPATTGETTSLETTPNGETEDVHHTRKNLKESAYESREVDVEIVYDGENINGRGKALNEAGTKPVADKSPGSKLTFKQTLIMGIAFALVPSVTLILVIAYFLRRRAKVSPISV